MEASHCWECGTSLPGPQGFGAASTMCFPCRQAMDAEYMAETTPAERDAVDAYIRAFMSGGPAATIEF